MSPRQVQASVCVLPNGVRAAAVHLPHLHQGSALLALRAGPRFERPEEGGISHFCEHMIFRGAGPFRDAAALACAFEEAGGALEAMTYRDQVVYTTFYAPGMLGRVLRGLAAMIGAPAFRGIEVERRIVLEELLASLDGRGRQVDGDNVSRALLFPRQPLSAPIDGSIASVEAFDRRALRAHHRRCYVGGNMVLVVAGPEPARRVHELARRALGRLPAGLAQPLGAPPRPTRDDRRLRCVHRAGSQTELRLCFLTPGEAAPEVAALSLGRRVLDDGLGSRLQGQLVERQGLAYEIWADLDLMPDVGVLECGAVVSHDKVVETTTALLHTLERLARTGPHPEELRRAKRRARWAIDSSIDSPAAIADWTSRRLLYGLEVDLLAAQRRIRAVRRGDVRTTLRKILGAGPLCLAVVGQPDRRARAALERLVRRWRPF